MPIPFNIQTTNIDLTDTLEEYVKTRLSKLDKVVDDNNTSAYADIELAKVREQNSGDIYRAEINLRISGDQLYAASETSDLYRSIDEVEEAIVREVKKAKGKKRDLFRRGARRIKNMIRRG